MPFRGFRSHWLFAALSAAVITAAVLGTERASATHVMLGHRATVERVAERHGTLLARRIASVVPEVRYLAGRDDVRGMLERGDGRDPIAQDMAVLMRATQQFLQLRALDASGREIVRVNFEDGGAFRVPDGALQPKSHRYYFREGMALGPGRVYVSPLDLNIEHGKVEEPPRLVLRVVAPVIGEAGNLGVVIANLPGDPLVRELREEPESRVLLVEYGGETLATGDPELERALRSDPGLWARIAAEPEGTALAAGHLVAWREVGMAEELEGVVEGGHLVVAAAIPRALLDPDGPRRRIGLGGVGVLSLATLVGLAAGLTRAERGREDAALGLARSESQLRRLSGLLLDAQEEERRALSRWLHDDLGQQFTALSLRLQMAPGIPDPERQGLVDMLERVVGSLRGKARNLRTTALDDLGLPAALAELVAPYADGPIRVVLDARLSTEPSRPVADAVYRIAQEALTNAVRHARCGRVDIGVRDGSGAVELTVQDDGAGFDVGSAEPGLGLLGMAERCAGLGGRFAVESAPGAGTTVRIHLPLEPT
ncbi:MAG: sensor histidine kinase [Alphaproteobacteria bacterium]|nr:sensor histidine kinase [Alphaproteobacteria bacterium]